MDLSVLPVTLSGTWSRQCQKGKFIYSRVNKLAQGMTLLHRIQTWVLLVESPKLSQLNQPTMSWQPWLVTWFWSGEHWQRFWITCAAPCSDEGGGLKQYKIPHLFDFANLCDSPLDVDSSLLARQTLTAWTKPLGLCVKRHLRTFERQTDKTSHLERNNTTKISTRSLNHRKY